MKPTLFAGGLLLLAAAAPTASPPVRERVTVPCELLNLRYDQARERWRAVPPPRTPGERNRVLRHYA